MKIRANSRNTGCIGARVTKIEYIKTTNDDLRAHSFGKTEPIDSWQWMLEISTHAERHIQQIREIKADPNFPKK
jgi:hypothetical protein